MAPWFPHPGSPFDFEVNPRTLWPSWFNWSLRTHYDRTPLRALTTVVRPDKVTPRSGRHRVLYYTIGWLVRSYCLILYPGPNLRLLGIVYAPSLNEYIPTPKPVYRGGAPYSVQLLDNNRMDSFLVFTLRNLNSGERWWRLRPERGFHLTFLSEQGPAPTSALLLQNPGLITEQQLEDYWGIQTNTPINDSPASFE